MKMETQISNTYGMQQKQFKRGKFIEIQDYRRKQEKSQLNKKTYT